MPAGAVSLPSVTRPTHDEGIDVPRDDSTVNANQQSTVASASSHSLALPASDTLIQFHDSLAEYQRSADDVLRLKDVVEQRRDDGNELLLFREVRTKVVFAYKLLAMNAANEDAMLQSELQGLTQALQSLPTDDIRSIRLSPEMKITIVKYLTRLTDSCNELRLIVTLLKKASERGAADQRYTGTVINCLRHTHDLCQKVRNATNASVKDLGGGISRQGQVILRLQQAKESLKALEKQQSTMDEQTDERIFAEDVERLISCIERVQQFTTSHHNVE